jgi:hypothetical protein
MKKILVTVVILTLILAACGDDGGNDSNDNRNETILTISNNSSRNFYSTRWNGTDFFNPYPYSNSGYIRSGDKLEAEVDLGKRFFHLISRGPAMLYNDRVPSAMVPSSVSVI